MHSATLLVVCLSIAPFLVVGQFAGYTGPCGSVGGSVGGAVIGTLPTLDHNVSGVLWIERPGRFCIENFYYDGDGPDAFIYLFYPGDEVRGTGGGYILRLNDQRAQFPYDNVNNAVVRVYLGETFRFALPERTPVACDFGNLTIWCRYAEALFTRIEFNRTMLEETVGCSPSPGRAFMGVLPNLFHDISGELFVKDNKTIIIRGFSYDGRGPDAFVYWYPVGVEADELGGGNIIPLNTGGEGAFDVGTEFTDELFELRIPDDMDVYTCDIGTFTIWCRRFTQFFTTLRFNTDLFTNSLNVKDYEPSRIYCDRPSTRPGVYIGELPTDVADNYVSGAFYVVDEYQLYIQLLTYYPGECTNAQLYFYTDGQMVKGDGGGYSISFSEAEASIPHFFANQDIRVDLRYSSSRFNARTCDIKFFTIWCENTEMHLTTIEIPDTVFTDQLQEVSGNRIFCTRSLTAGAPSVVSAMSYVLAGLLALVATYIGKP